jgi:hypothetical protein
MDRQLTTVVIESAAATLLQEIKYMDEAGE